MLQLERQPLWHGSQAFSELGLEFPHSKTLEFPAALMPAKGRRPWLVRALVLRVPMFSELWCSAAEQNGVPVESGTLCWPRDMGPKSRPFEPEST